MRNENRLTRLVAAGCLLLLSIAAHASPGKAAIATTHPLASQAGLQILR